MTIGTLDTKWPELDLGTFFVEFVMNEKINTVYMILKD